MLKMNKALQQIAPDFLSKSVKATEAASGPRGKSTLESKVTHKVLTS